MKRAVLLVLMLGACSQAVEPRDPPGPPPPPGPPTVITQLGAPGRVTLICGVVADAHGGAFIAIDTDADLDGATRGIRDLAIARVDARGELLWVRQLGATDVFTRGCALAVDGDESVYVAGLVNGRGAFDGEPLPSLYTALVVALEANGALRWRRLLGEASGGSEAMGVALGDGGDVHVLGYTRARLAPDEEPRGEGDVFLATLAASDGSTRALRLAGGSDEDLPFGLETTAEGLWLGMHTTSGIAGASLGAGLHLLDGGGTLSRRAVLEVSDGEQPAALASDGNQLFVAVERDAGGMNAALSLRRLGRDGAVVDEGPIAAAEGLRATTLACARDGRCAAGGRVTGTLDGLAPLGSDGDGWVRFLDRGAGGRQAVATYRLGASGATSTLVRAVAPAPDGSWLIAATTREGVIDSRTPLGLVDGLLLRARPRAQP